MDLTIPMLGLIIIVGFIGHIFYKYTKIPESLFMMLIGLAAGPVFNLVDQAEFISLTPIVITITLIIVLLDTGLSLNALKTFKTVGKTIYFILTVLFFSTLLVGAFMYMMGWELLHAILIGIISSGSTTIVSGSLLPRISVPEDVKQILILESIINDVTLVTGAVIITQVIQLQQFDFSQFTSLIVGPITIAIILGIISTIIWVNTLWRFYKKEKLTYIFTLGMLFVLYSLVEFLGGNGAIAVLVLSLSLGNLPVFLQVILEDKLPLKRSFVDRYVKILRRLRKRFDEIIEEVKETQVDFSFFIKNFFFAYLGMIFSLESMNTTLLVTCISIIALMFVSRYLSVRTLSISYPIFKQHSAIMTFMIARGFTATFTALLPSAQGVEIPQLKDVVLLLVLLSMLMTIIGSSIYERMHNKKTN